MIFRANGFYPINNSGTGRTWQRWWGRRPDGMSTFPWMAGKTLIRYATVVDTFSSSHVLDNTKNTWSAASGATATKRRKYDNLTGNHIFQPVALEKSGSCGPTTFKFSFLNWVPPETIQRFYGCTREFPWLSWGPMQRASSLVPVYTICSEFINSPKTVPLPPKLCMSIQFILILCKCLF